MTDKKHCTCRLPQDIVDKIRKEADKKHTSHSNVMTEILQSHFDHSDQNATPQTESSVTSVTIRKDKKKKLMRKERKNGISADEYIRHLLEPKQQFNLNVIVNDLMELVDTIQPLITTLNAVAKVLLRTEKAYDVQVKEILRIADEILTVCGHTYTLEYAQRTALLTNAVKKINEEIDRHRESEKRALRRRKAKAGDEDAGGTDQGLSQQKSRR